MNKKNLKFKIFAIFISTFISIFVLELVSRSYFYYKTKFAAPPHNTRKVDNVLGWTVKSNYSYNGKMLDIKGQSYPLNISTKTEGFRKFDKDSPHKNVFFLGDSYTQSVEVSDDKLFYSILKDQIGFDLYAFGAAGYGTFQEFLILEKYMNSVKPDIIVLQLCSNDFIDNYFKLEENSNYRVGKKRPYFTLENEVIFKCPKYQSALLHIINKTLDLYTTEKKIAKEKSKYEDYSHSIEVTNLIIKKITKVIPKHCKLICFVSDNYNPQYNDLKQICLQNKVDFINVPQAIRDSKVKGEIVNSFDGFHWNEKGHQIVAQTLYPHLKKALGTEKE